MLSKITHTLREQAFFVNEKACIKSDMAYDVSDPNLPVDISRRIEMLCRGETDEKIVLPQYVENKLSLKIFPTGQVDCLTVAYVFNVYCEEETEAVILSRHSKLKGYVWVNNEYIGKAPQGSIMQIKLKTGNNIFCFLLLGIKATPVLAVRLNKVANEEKVNYVSLSTNNSIATLYSENIVRITGRLVGVSGFQRHVPFKKSAPAISGNGLFAHHAHRRFDIIHTFTCREKSPTVFLYIDPSGNGNEQGRRNKREPPSFPHGERQNPNAENQQCTQETATALGHKKDRSGKSKSCGGEKDA